MSMASANLSLLASYFIDAIGLGSQKRTHVWTDISGIHTTACAFRSLGGVMLSNCAHDCDTFFHEWTIDIRQGFSLCRSKYHIRFGYRSITHTVGCNSSYVVQVMRIILCCYVQCTCHIDQHQTPLQSLTTSFDCDSALSFSCKNEWRPKAGRMAGTRMARRRHVVASEYHRRSSHIRHRQLVWRWYLVATRHNTIPEPQRRTLYNATIGHPHGPMTPNHGTTNRPRHETALDPWTGLAVDAVDKPTPVDGRRHNTVNSKRWSAAAPVGNLAGGRRSLQHTHGTDMPTCFHDGTIPHANNTTAPKPRTAPAGVDRARSKELESRLGRRQPPGPWRTDSGRQRMAGNHDTAGHTAKPSDKLGATASTGKHRPSKDRRGTNAYASNIAPESHAAPCPRSG